MNNAPKIGDRVRYPGKQYHVGPCTGTVLRVYEKNTWADDVDWDDPDVEPGINVFPTDIASERHWSICVQCDERPHPWPYGDDLQFAPSVGDVQPLRQHRREVRHRCVNGHDRCRQMLPSAECAYCVPFVE